MVISVNDGKSLRFSIDAMQLLDRYNFYKLFNPYKSLINVILFFLRFNSTKDFNPWRFSTTSIRLCDKLRTLNDVSLLRFSILVILFSCKSKTSKFLKFSTCFTYSIRFLLSINTLRLSTVEKLEISFILFVDRSRNVRFGKLTKFSIFVISLFYKFKYFIFSSPSSKGICLRVLESKVIFSTFCSLSAGLLYTMTMFGI